MINYNRLGYEMIRDFMNFLEKICKGLTRPKCKFTTQMIYGILAGNKVHLSEIACSLNETIRLKKTIGRLSGNLFAFEEKEAVISETHENLCCLQSLSAHFSKICVRTLGRHGKKTECKISYIPVRLCEFPARDLVLAAVYGFGAQPVLSLTNIAVTEKKKLCLIAAKIYLMRWRTGEYFKFKKQQFELEDLRVMSLQSIRNLNLFAPLATGYIGIMNSEKEKTIFMMA